MRFEQIEHFLRGDISHMPANQVKPARADSIEQPLMQAQIRNDLKIDRRAARQFLLDRLHGATGPRANGELRMLIPPVSEDGERQAQFTRRGGAFARACWRYSESHSG